MPRVTAGLWVQAYLARLGQAAIPGFVTAKGDATAGAVLVKQNPMDGSACVYQRSVDLITGQRTWVVLAEGAESDVDATIVHQRRHDPDLWVIEVEDREGRHLLGEPGLDS